MFKDNPYLQIFVMLVITGFIIGTIAYVDVVVTPAITQVGEAYLAESQTRQTIHRIQTYLLVRQCPALRGCTTWDEEDWQKFQKETEDHQWKHMSPGKSRTDLCTQ